jgi:hypothetical protein
MAQDNISFGTDGWFQGDSDPPSGEEVFTFGVFVGTVAAGVADIIQGVASYLLKRKKEMDGSMTPPLP